jgi:hypothetical protein
VLEDELASRIAKALRLDAHQRTRHEERKICEKASQSYVIRNHFTARGGSLESSSALGFSPLVSYSSPVCHRTTVVRTLDRE